MIRHVLSSFLLAMIFLPSLKAQENSLLASGDWYKFSVNETGVYRIRGVDLQGAGLDISGLDPANIKAAAYPGGPLPQANDAIWPEKLSELPIFITGAGDGKFDAQDEIIFYVQGPQHLKYTQAGFEYEHNPYSTSNYIFIGITNTPGMRVTTTDDTFPGGSAVNSFDDVKGHEESLNNLLESGRNWYGERFDLTLSHSFTFNITGIVNGSELNIKSAVMAQSFSPAKFTLALNGTELGSQSIGQIPDYLNPPSNNPNLYSIKGIDNTTMFTTIAGDEPAQQTIKMDYQKGSAGRSIGFLDYLLIHARRKLQLYDGQVNFTSVNAIGQSVTYQIAEMNSGNIIWDVSDVLTPKDIPYNLTESVAGFNDYSMTQKWFVAFDPTRLPVPEQKGKVANQNLPGMSTPDLLIVTYPDFSQAAQKLAQFRQTHDQLSSLVVTTDQIYNEFAGGRKDLTAIRNFARMLYQNGSLRYLLLMGRGSYDYLDIIPNNTNYVPTYESRNVLNPLETYSSDDYFGFMDEDEGVWAEIPSGNHELDIGVGRLPVTSTEQAMGVVDKIIRYDSDKKMLGDWRTKLVYVADDEDFNIHHSQANQLAEYTDTTYKDYTSEKIYLGSYQQESGGGGQTSEAATEAINRTVNNGALIINYTGHGAESGWAQEFILDRQDIREWNNKYRIPLFVTATCEFGRCDNPREISGGEMVVTQPNSGGIGILSTGRPVYANSNFILNEAFYQSVFTPINGSPPRLGDIMIKTKNLSVGGAYDPNKVGNRNFSLLADPSQLLAYPKKEIKITSLSEDGSPVDTLNAGAKIRLEGEVLTTGQTTDLSFNGTAKVVVYDNEVERETLYSPVFTYKTRENAIFRGNASVKAGTFHVDFIVPRNISNKPGGGKINVYAYTETEDAKGEKPNVKIGGTSDRPLNDINGPEISIYLGDSINTSRENINESTLIYAHMKDESGINISGFGVGNNIMARLDDEEFNLNSYYSASKNSYQEGWVVFPVNNLSKGHHSLTIKGYDVYNNSGEATIEFIVADPGTLVIKQVRNYPQPVFDKTTFTFDHNRPGETLEVSFELLGRNGQVLDVEEFVIEDSSAKVELMTWDKTKATEKLSAGLYFYCIAVRSRLDGASARKYQKMILIN